MKKLVILISIFLAFITLLDIVSAQHCTDDSQTILKLSSLSNAHGEIYSFNNYGVRICYDDYFGTYTGANPHLCDGNNFILNISAQTNAHAEITSAGNYGVGICYGDIRCALETGSCTGGRIPLLSLSGQTNAHLANGSFYSQNIICCSKGGGVGFCGDGSIDPDGIDNIPGNDDDEQCDDGNPISGDGCSSTCQLEISGQIGNVYWVNGAGNVITESCVNRTVFLVAETGIPANTEVNFEIKEDTDKIRDRQANVNPIDLKAKASWFISDGDMSLGDGLFEGDQLEFTFNASAPGTSSVSGILNVNKTECANTAPIAKIDLKEGIYFVNEILNFTHSSFDVEGMVTVEWHIDDSVFDSDPERTRQNNFTHIYTTPGQKTITLTVTDEQGLSDMDRVSILLLESPGTYAKITKPEHESSIRGLKVRFNGNSSYVVDYTGVPNYEVICLGGGCPEQTIGCPPGYPDPESCPLSVIDPNTKRNDFTEMDFTWTCGTGDCILTVDSGLGKVMGNKIYSALGGQRIEVSVISYQQTGSIYNDFVITNNNGCVWEDNGERSFWYDLDGNKFETTNDGTSLNDGRCGGDDFVPGGGDDCCPVGILGAVCVDPASTNDPEASEHLGIYCSAYECVSTYSEDQNDDSDTDDSGEEGIQIIYCRDYNKIEGDDNKKEAQCARNCAGVGQTPGDAQWLEAEEAAGNDYSVTSITCKWDDDDGCYADVESECIGCGDVPPNPDAYTCKQTVIRDECVDGERRIIEFYFNKTNSAGVVISDPEELCGSSACPYGTICTSESICGQSTVVLSFFSMINFIISALAIIAIYAAYIFVRRK